MAVNARTIITQQSKDDENVCPVCHDVVDIFAIGCCDHAICHRCAVRMRVLCNLIYCPICRTDAHKVLFVRHRRKFDSVDTTSFCLQRKYKMFFEDEEISKKFEQLLEHRCKICNDGVLFEDFSALRTHVQRQHQLFYCNLCAENIKLFSVDRKFYNRTDLARHNRIGDEDEKSYKGHPLCKFCDQRYFDKDELLKHLRKDHFYCHLCEEDGIATEYFSDYNVLKDHFRSEHFLCEEGECKDARFVNAFKTDIDYRGHWTQTHSASAGRHQAKQMRTIDININYASRPRGGASDDSRQVENRNSDQRNRQRSDGTGGRLARERRDAERKRRDEFDQAYALSASLADVQRQGHVSIIDPQLAQHSAMVAAGTGGSAGASRYQRRSEDFPTLDSFSAMTQATGAIAPSESPELLESNNQQQAGAANQNVNVNPDTLAKKLALSSRQSVKNGLMSESDFPSLPTTSQKSRPQKSFVSGKSKSVKTAWSAESPVVRGNVAQDFPALPVAMSTSEKSSVKPNSSVKNLSEISRNLSAGNLKCLDGPETKDANNAVSWGPQGTKAKQPSVEATAELPDRLLHLSKKNKSKTSHSTRPLSASSQRFKQSSSAPKLHYSSEEGEVVAGSQIDDEQSWAKVDTQGCKSSKGDFSMEAGISYGKFSVLSDYPEKPSRKLAKSAKENARTSENKADQSISKKTSKKDAQKVKNRKELVDTSNVRHGVSEEPKLADSKVDSYDNEKRAASPSNDCSDQRKVGGVTNQELTTTHWREVIMKKGDDGTNGVTTSSFTDELCLSTEDFPSLPAVAYTKPVSLLTSTSENNHLHPSVPILDISPSFVVDSSFGMPKSAASVPPGFDISYKPPPGFQSMGVGRLPPGFSSASGTSVNDISSSSEVGKCPGHTSAATASLHEAEYIPPSGGKVRGTRLLERIVAAIGNDNDVASFQEKSKSFRLGNISAAEYHEYGRAKIGHEKFLALFPELVALLPDIPKQQELFSAHQDFLTAVKSCGKTGPWSTLSCDKLITCVVCGQVVLATDKQDHEKAHNFDSEYPVLGNALSCTVR